MNDYSGEKFLDKLYSNLYMSDEVQHTMENNDKRYEAIRKYLERLERIHNKADTQTKQELLRSFYYEKYVVKEEYLRKKLKKLYSNISEDILKEQIETIINAQKASLDNWLDYLTNDNANYPLWAKYWAFQGMLKMGNYDEGIEGYQKRSKDTEGPFVDANPEILAKAISMIEKTVNKDNINDRELEKIITSGSFSKIYTILEKRYKNNVIEYSGTEGIWVKYNQGNKEDAIKLCNSLQNKNTHWCTAEESMAINQVCGPYSDSQEGGDFYVYYTKDKEGNYTLPRIAIRMIGNNKIGEIRGILEGQNLEEDMESILEEKLKEMTFLNEEDRKDAFDKLKGLRELTKLYKKTIQKEELTADEIVDIYTKHYGFGWTQDHRVEKIKKKRNLIDDFNNTFDKTDDFNLKRSLFFLTSVNAKPYELKITDEEHIRKCIGEQYRSGAELQFFDPKYSKDYSELALYAVETTPILIRYINPNSVNDYSKLANIAVKKANLAFQYVDPKYVDNYEELAFIVINKSPSLLHAVNPEFIKDYKKLAFLAVEIQTESFSIVNPTYLNDNDYTELAEYALKKMPFLISCLDFNKIDNYDSIALIAIKTHPLAIANINPAKVKDYDTLAKIAVTANTHAYDFVDKNKLSKKMHDKLYDLYLHGNSNKKRNKNVLKIIKDKLSSKKNNDNKKLGYIDIFSITILLFTFSFMIITIIKIINK